MNLGLSEERLAGLIAEDPAFKGVNGQFDRNLFTSRLRNAGIREDDYIKERSKVAVRSQIVEAVSDGFQPPKVLVDALKSYRDETRSIDYILLSNANIDPVKAPANDVISAWFEGVKNRYRAPEYRTFAYVKLQPGDIADASSITDDAVRAEYEKRKDSYKTHETRTIEQLPFPNKEMAQAAATQLKDGTATFDQIIKDQGKTATDVLLGDFTRENVPDPAFADPAFKITASGGTTSVIDGTFGPVILRVTNIRPETTRSSTRSRKRSASGLPSLPRLRKYSASTIVSTICAAEEPRLRIPPRRSTSRRSPSPPMPPAVMKGAAHHRASGVERAARRGFPHRSGRRYHSGKPRQ